MSVRIMTLQICSSQNSISFLCLQVPLSASSLFNGHRWLSYGSGQETDESGSLVFPARVHIVQMKNCIENGRREDKAAENKREEVARQMRGDIATLLQSGQDSIARIRVEHVIREQNILTANEFIELFCELVGSRLTIISKQRECPADLKEGICSLIFAAPRCSEIPELMALKDIFEKKYGRDFVSAAADLRPNAGVNRTLIEKLSVRTPSGEVKLKIMKEIAKEYQVDWDTTESEEELLKPPEELIEGLRAFVCASSLPVKSLKAQSIEPDKIDKMAGGRENAQLNFDDSASASKAAAESARKAIAAAEIAAYLAKKVLVKLGFIFINLE